MHEYGGFYFEEAIMPKFGRKTSYLLLAVIATTIVIAGSLVYLEKKEGMTERSFGSSFEAHQYLWGKTLEGAKSDKYSKYAIYASRILAVKHPEAYLRGDDLFLNYVMTTNGYEEVYLIRDVQDDRFVNGIFSGPPFSFNDVEFEAYNVLSFAQLYPENYPLFGYLDRRLFPISTTLKTWENKITQLELAEQLYFSLKENKGTSEGLYVIYCDNEETYVYDNGELIWAKNLEKTHEIMGNPILILNENYVWYPLMDIDDTAKDAVLDDIVKEYSSNVRIPQLTDSEKAEIEILKQVTELEGENQVLMATVVAAHTEGLERLLEVYSEFEAAWEKLGISSIATGVFQEIYKRSDYLSPITAYLAWISGGYKDENKIEAITSEYLKYTGSPTDNYSFAWGHIWTCMLVGYTIDESYQTRAGHCVWQAANISSVLDVLNIKNYIIEILYQNFHHIVYLPRYDIIVSNGAVVSVAAVKENKPPYFGISFISSEGKWSHPRLNTYVGTLSPGESINVLNFLKGKIDGDNELRGITGVSSFVSWPVLISGLEKEEWTPFKLP
jgi:hypothetical protein